MLLFAFSCLDDPDCFRLNNNVLGIAFRVLGSNAADSVALDSVSMSGIVWKPETEEKTTFVGLSLPGPGENSAVTGLMTFHFGETSKTINLGYRTKVQFVSDDCGARYIYSDLTVSEFNFDQVDVLNSTPGRDASAANIYVYRCPRGDTIGVALYQLTLPARGAAGSRPISARLNSILVDDADPFYVDKSAALFKLPVNMAAANTKYTFEFGDAFGYDDPVRTVALAYDVITETRFEACGEQKFVEQIELAQTDGVPFDAASIAVESDGDLRNVVTDPVTTNINLYRCPPTNIIQLAFINAAGNARSRKINSITPDFAAPLYIDTTYSRVQLPLNPDANTTTYVVELEGATETFTLNYSWSSPRSDLFPNAANCLERPVITDLSLGTDNPNAEIAEPNVLFPAVTNVTLEVAD